MPDLVFVDTNVFIYQRDPMNLGKQTAADAWLQSIWARRVGRVSYQVLSEFYFNIKRISGPSVLEDARAVLSDLLHWNPVAVDERLIQRAWAIEDRYQLNWWDALIVAAAQLSGCRYLLSEDLQDGQRFGRVTVMNPFEHDVAAVLG